MSSANANAWEVFDPVPCSVCGLESCEEHIHRGNQSANVITCLADVRPTRPSWSWRRRLALGKITVVMGDPGTGKTFISGDICTRITRGWMWPDGDTAPVPGNVLFLAAEDSLSDTVAPRLIRAGADTSRVRFYQGVIDRKGERLVNLEEDIERIDEALRETRCSLLVVDPISSYLGSGVDSYKDSDVRRVLTPLAKLAEKHQVAVLAIVHMTKGSRDSKALYRALGSIAFTGVARIVLAAGADPERPGRYFLMPVKQNICRPATTLAYSLEGDPDDPDGPAKLVWEPTPVDGVRVDQILGGSVAKDEESSLERAVAFLKETLACGPMDFNDLLAKAENEDIKRRTMDRAKELAGAESYRPLHNRGPWVWRLKSYIANPTASPDLAS